MLARILATAVAATTAATAAQAGENLWVYAKGTDTRPEGSYEFKFTDTIRVGKDVGSYTFHDIRPELEYGITDRLTIAGEVMLFNHDYDVGPCGDDDAPGPMCEAGDGTGEFSDFQYGGYEIMAKYNVLSPYKDAFGLSFAFGYENRDKYRLDGADIDQDSFTITTLLQKNFLDNTLNTVINMKTEFERRKSGDSEESVLEEEIAFDISIAASYRVAPKWFIGLEWRHQSDYLSPEVNGEYDDPNLQPSQFDLTDFRIGSRHQYGSYFGPSVHYAEQKWWATAGVLWQISGGGSEHSWNRGGKNYDEHEEMHIGLSFGYEM